MAVAVAVAFNISHCLLFAPRLLYFHENCLLLAILTFRTGPGNYIVIYALFCQRYACCFFYGAKVLRFRHVVLQSCISKAACALRHNIYLDGCPRCFFRYSLSFLNEIMYVTTQIMMNYNQFTWTLFCSYEQAAVTANVRTQVRHWTAKSRTVKFGW